MPKSIPIQLIPAKLAPALRVLRRGAQALVLERDSLRMVQIDADDLPALAAPSSRIYPSQHAELEDPLGQWAAALDLRPMARPSEQRLAPSLLIIKITSFCPLRCTYCYDYEEAAPVDIDAQRLCNLIDEALAISEPTLTLLFHGGEPLAKFPLIETATRHARQQAESLGKQLNFQIQTSGAVMNDRIASFLDENAFSIGLSLDGPPQLNDIIRILPEGRGSSAVVQRQIERYRDLFTRRSAVLTTVTRHNVRKLAGIVDYFAQQGFRGIDFSLFSPMGRGSCQSDLSFEARDYIAALCDIMDRIEGGDWPDFQVFTLLRLMDKLLLPSSRHHCRPTDGACGAGHGVVNVQADGAITGCDLLRGSEHVLGHAGQETLSAMLDGAKARHLRSRYQGLLQCHDCTWRAACGGTCGATSPGHHDLDPMECEAMQGAFEALVWRLHEGEGLLRYYLRHRERLIEAPPQSIESMHAVA
jgi:uncharacterized protein